MFHLTPALLQKGLTALGIAAGQVKQLDPDTKLALGRFFMEAVGSGDMNGYIKSRLSWLEERYSPPEVRARSVHVASRTVDGQFDDEPAGRERNNGGRRR